MNTKTILAIFCSLLFLQNVLSQNNTQQSGDVIHLDARVSQMDFVPGVLLVKFKDQVPARSTVINGLRKVGVTTVDALLEKYQVKTVEKLFPTAQPLAQKKLLKTYTGQTIEQPNLHNIYKIELIDPTKLYEAIEAFKQDATVEFAEPNYIYSIVADKPVSGVLTEEDARKLSQSAIEKRQSTVTPNDPLYSQQWYIPAIHADSVWVSTEGDTSQVIAFLDTGVDWHHPDLAENIWTNTAEANGIPGRDDDGDGFVDDIHGWDFINNDNDPSDDNSHGTHVAGIACAEGNNGIGIAGVNWHARIMPIKVFQSSGRGDAATITQGIIYAANKGATVINMSFGSYARSLTMEAALTNAYANCVLVAAAGNDGLSIGPPPPITAKPFYPAALSYVLGVQAGDAMGPEGFSNYDPDGPVYSGYSDLLNYEMKAPGSNIISTVPNGGYRIFSGTSMAAPIVSGAVALYRQLFPVQSQELMWGNLINTCSNNINLFDALNVHASPVLRFVSNTIVDTLAGDNNNGLVDAGETIQLWFTVRNTWGQSDSVFLGLRLGEFEDTSVAHVLNPAAFLGSISPYAKRTNETNPFLIHVSPNVGNNRDIVFEGSIWYAGSTDTIRQRIVFNVNHGQYLAGVMDSTLVLTPDRLWLVNSSFRVGANGKLFIRPGVHLSISDGFNVSVKGQVIAKGTPDSLIHITSPFGLGGGFWIITLNAPPDTFQYCWFSQMANALKGASSNFVVEHCVFEGINKFDNSNCTLLSGIKELRHSIIRNTISDNWLIFPISTGGLNTMEFNTIENVTGNGYSEACFNNGVIRHNNFIRNKTTAQYISSDAHYQAPFFMSADNPGFDHNNIIGNTPFISATGTADRIRLPNQYWGGIKSGISQIYDFWSNASLPIIDTSRSLDQPSDSAHGIVWKILVDSIDPQDQKQLMNPIGVGPHRFDVYFNRSMDTTFTPQLSFGVRAPFSQQAVSDSGRWSPDHRIWTAYKNIKLYTGDGINRIRVAAARDPEGFEIPNEDMRFEFLIDAAGSASTEFMATAGLGKINLEWNNTGLVDFLGFNMYRFTNKTDTTYTDTTLINTKLITDTLYTDFNVDPGKKYYYLYKVVRTDFSESNYSRVSGATALTSSPGDANGDLVVNVLDIVSTVSFILGGNPQPFIFTAADVNHDTTINVLDIVGTVNIILHPQAKIALNKTTTGSAHLDLVGNTISLTSDVPVSAIQFKMVGKGLKDMQFTPGAALSQFEIASNPLGDTVRIFVVYNMKGVALSQGINTLGAFAPSPAQATITNAIISDAQGRNILTNVFDNGKPLIPTEYSLEQNFPNPFNLSTQIQYAIPEKTRGKIVIYNLLGQKVRTFDLGERAPGRYTMTWDGKNEVGTVVSSGVYFYRFETDKFKQTKKLMMLK